MPLRLSMIENVDGDFYYNYKVTLSEQVDELWYNVVLVKYFTNYNDAVDAAQCWEFRQ
jgi:hypothetical protein